VYQYVGAVQRLRIAASASLPNVELLLDSERSSPQVRPAALGGAVELV
jgi:hypothetical protein